ncbi:MAG: arylsulfatase [Acidobacteria bacterium]|nr:arylsulfatase [Acidobacteriota bacterium]
MADDMGFADLGCYGSEISTPNVDRMAARGIRFTHFTNTARCCPTRAALLTGLYQHQAGVGMMVNDLGRPSYQGYLNDRCVTIAEALRPAGYRTLMAGKWHVGEERPHWPTDRGFERYFGLISGASSYFRLDPGRKMALNDQPFTPQGGDYYMTNAFTDHAIEFIDELGRGLAPFFLYLPFTSPHWPAHALQEDIAKYRGKYRLGWDELRRRRYRRMLEMGVIDKRWELTPRDPEVPAWADAKDKDGLDLRMAVYAAQIECMDRNVGRVLAKLKEIGAEDNTLVMFLADNGGCHEVVDRGQAGAPAGTPDSYLSYGRGWANASNTPFRLFKHWVHEGGISSPLVVQWPERIRKGGRISPQFGHVIDLMATAVDAAGAQYPKTFRGLPITPLEGRSLVPAFEGRAVDPQRAVFWEHAGNRAVRQGKWKLVSRYPGRWELYDLEADRGEMHELGAQEPGKAAELERLYSQWAARVGAFPPDQLKGGSAGKKKKKA